jgi:hypothetical protein
MADADIIELSDLDFASNGNDSGQKKNQLWWRS